MDALRRGAAIVVANVALAGCLAKPARPEPDPAREPRVISTAYFSLNGNAASPGMSQDQYSIGTDGVQDGDLLLFIANMTHGTTNLYTAPPGFEVITQHTMGYFDHTYFAAWKIADHEPARYEHGYGAGVSSGDSALALIAVPHADPTDPLPQRWTGDDRDVAQVDHVDETAPSFTTTRAGSTLVWAGGAWWQSTADDHVAAFTAPDGFTALASLGDRGDTRYDRATLSLAQRWWPTPGATGDVTGSTMTTNTGVMWSMLFAIAPAP